ncbi:hypothetical protein ABI59_14040 [Acidobacteria bacterium Mor1]|nr:hypothetical protein ABI59_14040 [Acidobacteria bacterium Mor1]
MRLKTTAILVLALLTLAGCSGGSEMTQPANTSPSVSAQSGDVKISLSTDRQTYARGETINMTMKVKNEGSATMTYSFVSGRQFDFSAVHSGGDLWNYSHGRNYTRGTTTVKIQPGETWTKAVSWDQIVNAGTLIPAGSVEIGAIVPGRGSNGRDNPQVGPLRITIQ